MSGDTMIARHRNWAGETQSFNHGGSCLIPNRSTGAGIEAEKSLATCDALLEIERFARRLSERMRVEPAQIFLSGLTSHAVAGGRKEIARTRDLPRNPGLETPDGESPPCIRAPPPRVRASRGQKQENPSVFACARNSDDFVARIIYRVP